MKLWKNIHLYDAISDREIVITKQQFEKKYCDEPVEFVAIEEVKGIREVRYVKTKSKIYLVKYEYTIYGSEIKVSQLTEPTAIQRVENLIEDLMECMK